MAEVLSARGYQTAGFVSAFTAAPNFGLDQGFAVYDANFRVGPRITSAGFVDTGRAQRSASETTKLALNWLTKSDPNEAFFLFVHYFDAHDMHLLPPKSFQSGFQLPARGHKGARGPSASIYDMEIRFMDGHFAALIESLEASEQLDRTIIVVLADHGQGLGDHGAWGHGQLLFDEQLRVPLIIKRPGQVRGQRVDALVQTIDLVPTLFDLLCVPADERPSVHGRSLLPLLDGSGTLPSVIAYSDSIASATSSSRPGESPQFQRADSIPPKYGLIDWPWKLIYEPQRPDRAALFNLDSDPAERVNRFEAEPDRAAKLIRELERLDAAPHWQPPGNLSSEDRAKLKELGYIE